MLRNASDCVWMETGLHTELLNYTQLRLLTTSELWKTQTRRRKKFEVKVVVLNHAARLLLKNDIIFGIAWPIPFPHVLINAGGAASLCGAAITGIAWPVSGSNVTFWRVVFAWIFGIVWDARRLAFLYCWCVLLHAGNGVEFIWNTDTTTNGGDVLWLGSRRNLHLASSEQWCWSGGRGILTELSLYYCVV